MGRQMKWTAAMIALIITILPVLSVTGIVFRQRQVKRMIHLQAEHVAAEELNLLASEYPGLKKGDEIYLGEKKYDIKEVNRDGDRLHVKAIDDILEKQLENAMNHQGPGKHGKQQQKNPSPDWISLLFNIITIPDPVLIHRDYFKLQLHIPVECNPFQPPEV